MFSIDLLLCVCEHNQQSMNALQARGEEQIQASGEIVGTRTHTHTPRYSM